MDSPRITRTSSYQLVVKSMSYRQTAGARLASQTSSTQQHQLDDSPPVSPAASSFDVRQDGVGISRNDKEHASIVTTIDVRDNDTSHLGQ